MLLLAAVGLHPSIAHSIAGLVRRGLNNAIESADCYGYFTPLQQRSVETCSILHKLPGENRSNVHILTTPCSPNVYDVRNVEVFLISSSSQQKNYIVVRVRREVSITVCNTHTHTHTHTHRLVGPVSPLSGPDMS